jgi:hypothetical protein
MAATASARQAHRVVESDFQVFNVTSALTAIFSRTVCLVHLPSMNVYRYCIIPKK